MKDNRPRLQDLCGLLHRLYPPALAESWDNVGLQVGDPMQKIDRILIALDADVNSLHQARQRQCQLLLTHHPLIFKPLSRISSQDSSGSLIFSAIRDQIAIVCAHTNLDRAADGLNDWLAAHLQLEQVEVLQPLSPGYLLKLVVYVPADHHQTVAEALFAAGAGQLGRYDHCAFASTGQGSFRPLAGSDPFVGQVGVTTEVEEVRLETLVPRPQLRRVLAQLLKAHPYEEVAYDLLPLDNPVPHLGLGRIGRLPQAVTLIELAERCKTELGCHQLRLVGEATRPVRKIAVCGGSGASLIGEASRQGADVLVTGDIKYHDACLARDLGLALLDAGHFATEQIICAGLQQALTRALTASPWSVAIETAQQQQDPFTFI
ncbi:MAG: Nif3-like dinuclear metal center hexameric protein [Desulfuromonas thiophila]|nr:Nif3-like dinuclear metal center hexameric protein [Desulfuromonas thiophila]MDY0397868.1 Nif3-like dinuclear metal center hexameric protein [Desulfuromonas thiophila]